MAIPQCGDIIRLFATLPLCPISKIHYSLIYPLVVCYIHFAMEIHPVSVGFFNLIELNRASAGAAEAPSCR